LFKIYKEIFGLTFNLEFKMLIITPYNMSEYYEKIIFTGVSMLTIPISMKSIATYLFFAIIMAITSILWIASCTHEPDLTGIPEICFEGDILTIFKNSCAISGCHDGSGESDLILNSYQNIMEGIKPGDPSGSEIYKAITTTSGENKMPPDQPLSADNRTLIRVWIEQGAKETTCPGN
jgi:hypothetical protein